MATSLPLVVALASLTAQQAVPVVTLSKPAAEHPEGFSNLSTVRELPDGRVMTVEVCERVVKLLDFAAGTVSQVGRTGSGPGEYQLPQRLLALPGDSTAIYDAGNRRFLVIHPDGRPGRFFAALPTITETRGASVTVTGAFNARSTDAAGRMYAPVGAIAATDAGPVRTDSVSIERWNPATGKRDTLVRYRQLNAGPILEAQELPFFTTIQWAVAADGRIAMVDPRDYHVEFAGAGSQRVAAKPIAFTPVRVSEAHQRRWRDEQGPPCARGGVVNLTSSTGQAIRVVPQPTREPARWPEVLPPFLTGAASFGSDGLLWVQRTVATDAPPAFDLIDGTGRVVKRVILPPRAKLLGFGKASVYVLRVDDDDLQYVQRHPLP